MKTISDLNSKWIWRLLKVVWGLFITLVFIFGSIIIIDENLYSYSPKVINDLKIKKEQVDNFLKKFNIDFIEKKTLTALPKDELYNTVIKLFSLGITIEGVGKYDLSNIEFNKDSCERGINIWIEKNELIDLSYFQCYNSKLKDAMLLFLNLDKDWENEDWIIRDVSYKFYGEYPKKDYISSISLITNIAYIIFLAIGIYLVFLLIIPRIIYYIILGDFFPKK